MFVFLVPVLLNGKRDGRSSASVTKNRFVIHCKINYEYVLWSHRRYLQVNEREHNKSVNKERELQGFPINLHLLYRQRGICLELSLKILLLINKKQ